MSITSHSTQAELDVAPAGATFRSRFPLVVIAALVLLAFRRRLCAASRARCARRHGAEHPHGRDRSWSPWSSVGDR